ncbi:MAG: polysaccharide export outer membrane protein [Saprospiraceae bacterium]|jgi:polysaccharide export outer membrane protein
MFYQLLNKSGKFTLLLVLTTLLMQSCIHHKDLVMLNGNETLPDDFRSDKLLHVTQTQKYEVYKIHPYDQLMIKVNAFEGSTEQFLNREFATETTTSREINYDPASLYFNTYTVDQNGNLDLPVVEKISVAGLTTVQIKEKLDEAYKPYLKFASTNVKIANSRITVMGEVNSPGVHYLYNDQNTILDAISMAGDFTDFGNRKKVKLLRHTDEGLATIYLNMNRSEFLYSDYYYIRPFDVIYVEPTKKKAKDVGANSTGIILSAISVGALILSLFTR